MTRERLQMLGMGFLILGGIALYEANQNHALSPEIVALNTAVTLLTIGAISLAGVTLGAFLFHRLEKRRKRPQRVKRRNPW